MTTEGASNGTDRETAENSECTHTDADAGHSTELDARDSATATSEGAGTGLMAKGVVVHPVFSDGIARTDRHKVPVTAYCPPPPYARPTPSSQHITIHPFGSSIFFPGIEDHHSDPLPESSQETAIRAWKRVTIRNVTEWCWGNRADLALKPPVVLSRHSKQQEQPMAQARCLHYPSTFYKTTPSSSPHEAPDQNCSCGFYGWRDRKFEDLDPFASIVPSFLWEPFAEVDFYGRVIEHEWGYRAEFQRVMAIHLGPGDSRDKILGDVSWADLARAIGIPIVDQHGVEHK